MEGLIYQTLTRHGFGGYNKYDPEVELKIGKSTQGIVSFVESHSVLYIQPEKLTNCIGRQVIIMNLYYANHFASRPCLLLPDSPPQQLSVEKIAKGTSFDSSGHRKADIYCAAPDPRNEFFYRAQILELISPTVAKVKYMDYGDSQDVEISQLMELSSEFRRMNPVAFKCCLDEPLPACLDLEGIKAGIGGASLKFRTEAIDEDTGVITVHVEQITFFETVGPEKYQVTEKMTPEERSKHKSAVATSNSFQKVIHKYLEHKKCAMK